MPRNTSLHVTTAWSEISDADTATITVQNIGPHDIEIMATPTATPPASDVKGLRIPATFAVIGRTLAEVFPGVVTPVRLYARLQDYDMTNQKAEVLVSLS